jgi:HPt (histidine-containing phosphotransfer) domain-containing protein
MRRTPSEAGAKRPAKNHAHAALPSAAAAARDWPPAAASRHVFHLDEALACCYDRSMFLGMAEFFCGEAGDLLDQMRAAAGAADAAGVARAAHRLNGTVLYLGAAACRTAVEQVERAGMSGDLAAAAGALDELDAQVALLKEALAPYCQGQRP